MREGNLADLEGKKITRIISCESDIIVEVEGNITWKIGSEVVHFNSSNSLNHTAITVLSRLVWEVKRKPKGHK